MNEQNAENERKYATINALADATGADYRHVKKWLVLEKVPSREESGHVKYDLQAGVDAINRHKKRKPKSATTSRYIRAQTRLLEAKAAAAERQNQIAEEVASKRWGETAEFLEALAQLMSYIENVPSKAGSAYGLTAQQVAGVRQLLDEARAEAHTELERSWSESAEAAGK
jgi:hypothetical protein